MARNNNNNEVNEENRDDEENRNDNDNDSDDDETTSVEDPYEIVPVIEESNDGEREEQVTSLTQRNDRKLLEVMYTEVLSNDVYSLMRKFFKHKSMKHLKTHNGDLIRNWIITRTATVTLYHCLAFVLTIIWRVLAVLNRWNLRRLLDLMHSVAHYYRNRRTIKRVFEPEKKANG